MFANASLSLPALPRLKGFSKSVRLAGIGLTRGESYSVGVPVPPTRSWGRGGDGVPVAVSAHPCGALLNEARLCAHHTLAAFTVSILSCTSLGSSG